jgi:hypothetical protein
MAQGVRKLVAVAGIGGKSIASTNPRCLPGRLDHGRYAIVELGTRSVEAGDPGPAGGGLN